MPGTELTIDFTGACVKCRQPSMYRDSDGRLSCGVCTFDLPPAAAPYTYGPGYKWQSGPDVPSSKWCRQQDPEVYYVCTARKDHGGLHENWGGSAGRVRCAWNETTRVYTSSSGWLQTAGVNY